MPPFPIIAADIGNSRTKLGYFAAPPVAGELPTPTATLTLSGSDWPYAYIADWLNPLRPAAWQIASVNRAAASQLSAAIAECCPNAPQKRLTATDLPLAINLLNPEQVGIDRLLGAVAANHLRQPDHSAVVLHVGTAITANLVTPDGAFAGGAILPGIALSAQALHDHTDLLPRIDMAELIEAPPIVGAATEPAIRSGLFWGAVGGMRELVARLSAAGNARSSRTQVFLTGGAAPSVAHLLGPDIRHEPHLVLAGIALAASR